MSSQLHQVLAVEGNLEGIAKTLREETTKTFGKAEHFSGHVKRYEMFDENEQVLAPEVRELVTTVDEKLEHLAEAVIRHYDAMLQKETTNQIAKADLVVNGVTIAKDVPATFLLGLENRLGALREVYKEAPTLAPGIAWDEDTQAARKGVFNMRHPEEAFITAKKTIPVVLYHATDKHPAQVKESTEDIKVGKRITAKTCGMITPAKKSMYLKRIDELIQATKQARMLANNAEVPNVHIGDAIFKYINAE